MMMIGSVILCISIIFFFSSRRRHTRFLPVSWARRCVQETDVLALLLLVSIVGLTEASMKANLRRKHKFWCFNRSSLKIINQSKQPLEISLSSGSCSFDDSNFYVLQPDGSTDYGRNSNPDKPFELTVNELDNDKYQWKKNFILTGDGSIIIKGRRDVEYSANVKEV
eukprot:TRINITY_DN1459_c0_g1_i11.p1 TRINITY_DN1459_c0_g1~~TRINITY_DN1459_c0_g1_i11.p1  ORF type:complete len:167 (-),score=49.07 TRINITY_DN1459_c0_g1_i11:124-624(-)